MPAIDNSRPRWLETTTTLLAYAGIYVILGAISLDTNYVQTNTATVWIPTGFSIGLLVARGLRQWPAIMLGAFVLNIASNVLSTKAMPIWVEIAIAAPIAAGNTGEALLGCHLLQRFAGGKALLSRPMNVAMFAIVVATLPPLVSMSVGVATSRIGGLIPSASTAEVMVTWYLANALGILILTAPVIGLLGHTLGRLPVRRMGEAACLAFCLLFVSQAISGMTVVPALHDWPRTYMIIPLLLWAAFRFQTLGAVFAILLVAAVSIIGTMRGFEAFPSASRSRSLLDLQVFLGLNAITTLAITAALAEIERLQGDIEHKVRIRTDEVERLVRARNLFTTLVVHDLQSPLYGVRNALRAAVQSIRAGHMTKEDIASAMGTMDETCTALAAQVQGLLTPRDPIDIVPDEGQPERLADVVARIVAARHLPDGCESVTLTFERRDLMVSRPRKVERILDGLIGNALKFGPAGDAIDVCAYQHAGNLEILVIDRGSGVRPEKLAILFRPEMRMRKGLRPRETGGLGLYLASEQATALGGRLTYINDPLGRSTFRLTVPY